MKLILRISVAYLLVTSVGVQVATAQSPQRKPYFPPEKVTVLPILHVPKDLRVSDDTVAKMMYRHVEWAQNRYQELLGATFEIATPKTQLFRGRYTLNEYKTFDNKVGSHIHAQHLRHLNVNRFNCPYILFTVLYNPNDGFPFGRGGSMNGGFNTGGGTVLLSSFSITNKPNAQSTIQHELGHAFGLPHIDAYGYQLRSDSPSIMAYNPKHHTNRFRASATPGVFIPEDLRGLALNKLALPNLKFDPRKDVPPGYEIKGKIKSNSAGSYPGSPDYKIEVSTDAGATLGTKIDYVVLGKIEASPGPKLKFDARSMWHSDVITSEANIDLKFPFPVELTSIQIYGGHSGKTHPVKAARVLVPEQGGAYREVTTRTFPGLGCQITFPATESQAWRLALTPGASKKIVVRGIRFYSGDIEIFRPPICLVQP